MPSDSYPVQPRSRTRAYLLILAAIGLVLALGAAVALARGSEPERAAAPEPVPPASAAPAASTAAPLPAVAPPADLPVITYAKGPRGLPADPGAASATAPTEALRPTERIALYDAPGGKPRAFLPPRISGLPVVAPIVAREAGWAAVLAPSANQRIGWVPTDGWRPEPLRDHLLVDLSDHRLTWTREGEEQQSWKVAVGSDQTPTPPGRTFVMGRTNTQGTVYAGLDALVLGSVPENKEQLAASLRGAHTGIHAWSSSSAFGRSVSNGCVRMPAAAQRTLLKEIDPGTPVLVVA
ncbi:L,D-transpeptidase [Actinoplanes aureus]|uniref:L,D-transpeptidase n=1 Tax=Actinoplanes aureus TaxID=2792083 RepID=UPI0028156A2B|nr:L,D-transpeptidase [Actinoplanes aureus]